MRRGAQALWFRLSIRAPMRERGSMIRFMGREHMESSPVSSETKGCPARMPQISRVVVPLFPTSRMEEGADSPCRPFPWIRISWGDSSISMPSFRKQEMVERQSAPLRKLVTRVVPSARAPNMTLRWEMLLSPGTVMVPFNAFALVNFMSAP